MAASFLGLVGTRGLKIGSVVHSRGHVTAGVLLQTGFVVWLGGTNEV